MLLDIFRFCLVSYHLGKQPEHPPHFAVKTKSKRTTQFITVLSKFENILLCFFFSEQLTGTVSFKTANLPGTRVCASEILMIIMKNKKLNNFILIYFVGKYEFHKILLRQWSWNKLCSNNTRNTQTIN